MKEQKELNIGDEVVFFKGKDNRNIAYTDNGKVILCIHDIPLGYAKIKKVVAIKERYILVKAQHIVRDLYSGTTYDDFIKVLPLHGYKIGFNIALYCYDSDTNGAKDHYIYAYNLKTGIVIIANTYNNCTEFDTIRIFIPNIDICVIFGACSLYNEIGLLDRNDAIMSIYDAVPTYRKRDILFLISNILKMADRKLEDRYWNRTEKPHFYKFVSDNIDISKILEVPESLQLFKDCNFLRDLLSEEEILKIQERAKKTDEQILTEDK